MKKERLSLLPRTAERGIRWTASQKVHLTHQLTVSQFTERPTIPAGRGQNWGSTASHRKFIRVWNYDKTGTKCNIWRNDDESETQKQAAENRNINSKHKHLQHVSVVVYFACFWTDVVCPDANVSCVDICSVGQRMKQISSSPTEDGKQQIWSQHTKPRKQHLTTTTTSESEQ